MSGDGRGTREVSADIRGGPECRCAPFNHDAHVLPPACGEHFIRTGAGIRYKYGKGEMIARQELLDRDARRYPPPQSPERWPKSAWRVADASEVCGARKGPLSEELIYCDSTAIAKSIARTPGVTWILVDAGTSRP